MHQLNLFYCHLEVEQFGLRGATEEMIHQRFPLPVRGSAMRPTLAANIPYTGMPYQQQQSPSHQQQQDLFSLQHHQTGFRVRFSVYFELRLLLRFMYMCVSSLWPSCFLSKLSISGQSIARASCNTRHVKRTNTRMWNASCISF